MIALEVLKTPVQMSRIFALFDDEFSPHRKALLGAPDLKAHFLFEVHPSLADLGMLDPKIHSALCLYVNIKTIDDAPYERMLAFIRGGGGLMAIHATSNAFRNQPSFFDVLGARFVRHGKITRYGIGPANADDPLASGVDEFEVEDELYRQQYRNGVKTHFVCRGRRTAEPVAWSNAYGKGKVIGISPGHRVETMQNEDFQKIVFNGLKMVCKQ